MKVGSLVQYRYYGSNAHHGWGVVTDIHHNHPNRPFFFVSWAIGTTQYNKKLEDTWYHPERLEVVCE